MSNAKLHEDALTECKYDISVLDFDNIKLVPSFTVKLEATTPSFMKAVFPDPTDDISRADQYQFACDYVSVIHYRNLSVTSYVQFTCPENLNVDSKLWGRECYVALIGTVSLLTDYRMDEEKDTTSAIVFDQIDGDLVFSEISELSEWEELINNTEVFRDMLFNAIHAGSAKGFYKWNVIHKMLKHFNFDITYSHEEGEDHFMLSQTPIFI